MIKHSNSTPQDQAPCRVGLAFTFEIIEVLHEITRKAHKTNAEEIIGRDILSRAEGIMIRLKADAPVNAIASPETKKEIERLIREKFDNCPWYETKRWTDVAKNAGLMDLYDEMKKDLIDVV